MWLLCRTRLLIHLEYIFLFLLPFLYIENNWRMGFDYFIKTFSFPLPMSSFHNWTHVRHCHIWLAKDQAVTMWQMKLKKNLWIYRVSELEGGGKRGRNTKAKLSCSKGSLAPFVQASYLCWMSKNQQGILGI